MPRRTRAHISREFGLYHITSNVVGGDRLFGALEKEHLLRLIERFTTGFYVSLHSFVIMSTHVHLLVSERRDEAQNASGEELLARYHRVYGEAVDPPVGRQLPDGSFVPDEDGGLERLRHRLGSVSQYVQEIKQRFAHWYNQRRDRKGHLWGERFGGLLVEKGDAALAISAYIDLNAVRAGMVRTPEEYRWCSLGLRAREPERAAAFVTPLPDGGLDLAAYRLFVYRQGEKEVKGKASIDAAEVARVEALCGRMGRLQLGRCRVRNFSEGLALGSREFVEYVQRQVQGKPGVPRPVRQGVGLFCGRVLASP